MPSGKNWVNFVYVNIAFVVCAIGVFYYSQIGKIKSNWPLYRCNPLYIFLADDIQDNVNYCFRNVDYNHIIEYIFAPIMYIINFISKQLSSLIDDNEDIRNMFNSIRLFFSSMLNAVFNSILKLFQNTKDKTQDLNIKTVGMIDSLATILDGSLKTTSGSQNNQSGIRSLGKCFHPDTSIKLKNGNIKRMKNIDLGDILEDDSVVETVLKIDNKKKTIPFYQISNGVNRENILVTGSHLVFDKESNSFIKVEHYRNAKLTNITYDWFCCLITDTHNIKIGDELFWDWEDHFIKYKMLNAI